jgi:hypothetical protein
LRDGWVARFDGARQLAEGNDWDVEFAGQTLEATGDFGDFLLAAVFRATGSTRDELEVVDDDKAEAVLGLEAAGLGAHFHDVGHGRIVDIEGGFG